MIKMHGIKNCGSVKKAMVFLESQGVEYEFIDFKKEFPSVEKIEHWLKFVPLNILCNSKGTTYKKLGLKEKNLDEKGIKRYLAEVPTLIKRPIIEYDDTKVIVGFDENLYKEIWGK